ncbi:MFS transporter [Pseudorhodoferax sp.]|uniref:MFS transporter n=1 Tax=Pseudorhodoferax sp. TaxID=1993553 RepID=UPI002DD6328E|nr:MFS transporter [Pseudorhodoferax sp.]
MDTASTDAAPATRAPMGPLVFAALTGTMAMMAFVAVVGPIVRRLGLPEWVAGLSVTAGGLLWMLLARWWGGVGDRRGRKPVLLIGFAAFALAYWVLAIGIDLALHQQIGAMAALALLIASRATIGAFYAAVPPTAAAVVADHTLPRERPAAMAKLGSANAMGLVLGPAAAGWLAGHDLALALYAAAVLPVIALVVVWLALPGARPAAAQRPPGAKPMGLFDARLRVAALTGFAAMGSVAIAQVLVGFFAIDRLALPVAEGARVAGLALTCVGCALIVSQQCVMRLKTVPLARWIVLGALIAGSGAASVAAVQSPAMLLGSYGVMAFGMGLIFPNFQAMAANAVQPHEQGAAAGTLSAAQGLGMVLGPIVGTLLYRQSPALPYLLVGAGLWALALFSFVRLRHAIPE